MKFTTKEDEKKFKFLRQDLSVKFNTTEEDIADKLNTIFRFLDDPIARTVRTYKICSELSINELLKNNNMKDDFIMTIKSSIMISIIKDVLEFNKKTNHLNEVIVSDLEQILSEMNKHSIELIETKYIGVDYAKI